MDFNLKQWREQQQQNDQSEEQEQTAPSAKQPRLLHLEQPSASALPLFVTEPTTNTKLSAYPPDSTPTPTIKFSSMGSYFSLGQWEELELQALIYRHMLAGAAVPPELVHLVQKSLFNSSQYPYYLPHYPHLQSAALVQSGGGYWGRGAMDPEPGRCRRTDGKKWRCSRDVVTGHKYCERHMNRGRNRSRKPVEIPTTPSANNTSGGTGINDNAGLAGMFKAGNSIAASRPLTAAAMAGGGGIVNSGSHFAFSGTSPSIDLLHLSHRSSKSMVETRNDVSRNEKSSGQILRHFFDDWPRSLQESENAGSSARTMTMTDFSLKLSTGDGNDSYPQVGNIERERGHSNWNGSWGTNQVASMGGPLAEALRSSTSNSNSSPTSVLHQLQRAPASEASYITS